MKDWDSFYPFPLNPGPFHAGYSGQVDDSVPNCHKALSRDTSIGHLWTDETLDGEVFKKAELQWASSATAIFATVGIDAPPEIKPRSIKATSSSRDSLTEGTTTSTATDIMKVPSGLTVNEADTSSVTKTPLVARTDELSTSLGEDVAMSEAKADQEYQSKDAKQNGESAQIEEATPAEEVAPEDKVAAPIQSDEVVASVDESQGVQSEGEPAKAQTIPPESHVENGSEQSDLVASAVKAPDEKPKAKKKGCCCFGK